MTDDELGKRVRLLAADSISALSVKCWLCDRTAGEPCLDDYTTRVRADGFHPLRGDDARKAACMAVARLVGLVALENS